MERMNCWKVVLMKIKVTRNCNRSSIRKMGWNVGLAGHLTFIC